MARWSFLIFLAIFGATTDAIPTVAFPINSQIPPVARVSEPFSYTFSPSTFDSSSPLSYTLSNSPSWLSLENGTRQLSGKPSTADVGEGEVTGISIVVTASDESGSASMNSTLVISKKPRPTIQKPLLAQLPTFGACSAPSTILYHPSTSFSFNFEPGTFGGDPGNLSYYAVTLDNTPLPSWITFDGSSLSFQGRTPDYASLIQPPQTFGIQLIASDIEGFAGESIVFEIEVGIHLLAFNNSNLIINATTGTAIDFRELQVELDGTLANASSLVSITAETPSWLAFDNMTYTLSGMPPPDSSSSNVTITATDIYGDKALASIYVSIDTSIFSGPIGNHNVTVGTTFSDDLSSSLRNKSDIVMTVEFNPSASWLSFDSETFVLSGQVPSSHSNSNINVTLNATSKLSHLSNSQSFELAIVSASLPPGTTLTTARASATAVSKPASAAPLRRVKKGIIAAIVVPIVLLAIALLVCGLCYRRRRQNAKNRPKPLSKAEISAPIEGSFTTETKLHDRIIPKSPLQLDTSEFGDNTNTDMFGNNKNRRIQESELRRSQTTSAMTGALTSEFTSSESSANRTRAHSDNTLSNIDKSWRSTQDSAYPTIGSKRHSSQRLSRNYSNYLRKGHTRRSGQVLSSGVPLRQSRIYSIQPSEGSMSNPRASELSLMSENLTVLSKQDKVLQPTEYTESNKQPQVKRKPTLQCNQFEGSSTHRRRSGVGHGGRESISPVSGMLRKRRSVGHGQDWTSSSSGMTGSEPGLTRNSKTWVTVNGERGEHRRRSTGSDLSIITDLMYPKEPGQSSNNAVSDIRLVPRAARESVSSNTSRPLSRPIGSSPFFGGSARNSQKRSRKARASYADSPTVPEEMIGGLENVIIHGHREDSDPPRDPFGISYGSPREGTRQLRSFIQTQLTRSNTKNSLKALRSLVSRDSRFESASVSTYSQSTQDIEKLAAGKSTKRDENVQYLDDDSEGSWETQHSSQEKRGNFQREYGLQSPADDLRAEAPRSRYPSSAGRLSRSNPNSPIPGIGQNARIVPGRGRRPINVDTQPNQGSVRVRVELDEEDYSAHV